MVTEAAHVSQKQSLLGNGQDSTFHRGHLLARDKSNGHRDASTFKKRHILCLRAQIKVYMFIASGALYSTASKEVVKARLRVSLKQRVMWGGGRF